MIVALCAMNIQDPLLLYYENNASGFHVKFPVEYPSAFCMTQD